jgi:lipopolysaccharide/colanic/teichoic acid biosynthesis glycosyltransferase
LYDDVQHFINSYKINVIIDTEIANHHRYVNKYFEFINALLVENGVYIGCVETHCQRNKRVFAIWNKHLAKICILFEFIIHRVFPKISFIKQIYFAIGKGKYRFLTLAETLGRLVSCGFKIRDYAEVDGLSFYNVKKARKPYYDMDPSYGLLIKLKRIGVNGKIFHIYKFRTMHPYAEYLHDYVLNHHRLNCIGKPMDDFRLADWGRFLRRTWLDEIPQLYNFVKGDMKLVGVRPVSERFLQEYPREYVAERLKYKPGCIPPYVSLLRKEKGLQDVIESEKIYLEEQKAHPLLTDLKYAYLAILNIVTNKVRSM